MSNDFQQKNTVFFNNIFTLDKAPLTTPCRIKQCHLFPEVKTRFAEMGLVPSTIVTVVKKAPLGDPLEINVRGYRLCIRATDAKYFVVEIAN